MPLVLSWENPETLFATPASYAVLRDNDTVISEDLVWGFHLFPDDNTAEGHNFNVVYYDRNGQSVGEVRSGLIEAWELPATACLIEGTLTKENGAPDAGRVVQITDSASDGTKFIQRIVANQAGKVAFVLMPDAKVLVRCQGAMKAWDVCIPDERNLAFEDLGNYGSIIDTDRRGWY